MTSFKYKGWTSEQRDRHRKRTHLARKVLGTQCALCGNPGYRIRHKDPDDKVRSTSETFALGSEQEVESTLRKAHVLCVQCDERLTREQSERRRAGDWFPKHGSPRRYYTYGCRCDLCVRAGPPIERDTRPIGRRPGGVKRD